MDKLFEGKESPLIIFRPLLYEDIEEPEWEHRPTPWSVMFTAIGAILFLLDVISDIYVTVTFCIDGQYLYFAISSAILLIASLVSSLEVYRVSADNEFWTAFIKRFRLLPVGIALASLGLGTLVPICGHINYLYWSYESKDRQIRDGELKYFHSSLTFIMNNAIQEFVESLPQVLLQLYVLVTIDDKTSILKILSILFSFASIANSIRMSFSLIFPSNFWFNRLYVGMFCQFVFTYTVVCARVLSLIVLAHFNIYCFLLVYLANVLFFKLLFSFNICQFRAGENWGDYERLLPRSEAVENIERYLLLVVLYLSPLRPCPLSYRRFILYHSVMLVQNITMLIVTQYYSTQTDNWFEKNALNTVVILYCLGSSALLISYLYYSIKRESNRIRRFVSIV